MPSQEEIEQQQQLLAAHRRTLATLLAQHATFTSAYAPPQLVAGIAEARAGIAGCKAALRAWGVGIEDHLDDVAQVSPLLQQDIVFVRTLRPPVSDFKDREHHITDLVQALERVIEQGHMAAISGVRGIGGGGKTEFAYTVVQHLAPHFPHGQVYIDLQGASSMPMLREQALQRVIRIFHPTEQLSSKLDELRDRYWSVLQGKRVLILADNAQDAAQVQPLLPPVGCALLITSRQRFTLPGMIVADLDSLPAQEAAALLRAICPRIGDHAEMVAKLCGYLPLALRVSASLLANAASLRIARYLERLADERTRLAQLSYPNDPALDVEASLRLSYDALDTPTQAGLCQLSVFPTSFTLAAAMAVVDVAGDVEALLNLLLLRSLLEWDEASERYDLHNLVRAFAAAQAINLDAVRLRHAQHYAQVALHCEELYQQGQDALFQGLMLFDQEQMHINAGWKWAREQQPAPQVNILLLQYAAATASIGTIRYAPDERIAQLKAAQHAAEQLNRFDITGLLLHNLGGAYAGIGDISQAISCYEQFLAVARKTNDAQAVHMALGNLGNTYMQQNRIDDAITCYLEAHQLTIQCDNKQGRVKALRDLGAAYLELADLEQAAGYLEQSLYHAHEINDREGEAIASWRLGLVREQQGDLVQAEQLMQRCVAYMRQIKHPDVQQYAAYLTQMQRRFQESA